MPATRLGVIGAGLIWLRTHKAILATMPEAFVPVAFSELREDRRAALAAEFPSARIVSDYQELLALPEVDAVLILTPLPLNAPVARAALQAGKHVIMEKPIARSVVEGRQLIAMARESGRMLCVTEQMAYRTAEAQVAEMIASGEIGDLVLWECVQHLEGDPMSGPMSYASTEWRKQADFPLGTMFDGGIHLIAGLSTVFGIPSSIAATGKQLRPEYGEYDQISALFEYSAGFSGLLSHSSYLPPEQNHFVIFGTNGFITVEYQRLLVAARGRPVRTIELSDEDAYRSMWQALAKAFAEQREPYYTPERAVADVAILEAINQAIKSATRVEVAVTQF